MTGKRTVVQFGAGAIGRGFVGQLWTDAEFEVVFVDIDPSLIEALNRRRSYPLRLVDFQGHVENLTVGPVRAVDGRDIDAVAGEIASCTMACTAVGVNVFGHLATTIARGVEARLAAGGDPLNIICCENQIEAGALLRTAVGIQLKTDESAQTYLANSVAFVDASVGRMVPPPTPELLAEDPLLILAEPFAELPIDAATWIGAPPAIVGMQLKNNFAGYVARKLFTHNGGHAAVAYNGYLAGYDHIWQAVADPEVCDELKEFWRESGKALVAAYGFQEEAQAAHEKDLLQRFQNRALGDTIRRVARDPLRKLRADDRLVGAALLCEHTSETAAPFHICRAIVAALRYDAPDDIAAAALQKSLRSDGIGGVLETVCGLAPGSALAVRIAEAYASAIG